MKIRLGRGAMVAAGAVALSLFAILCMLPYGAEDYLSPERILARKDALRFQIASLFVEPFGAGAFLGMGLVFVWSVIAFFRESVGSVAPRAVGLMTVVPAFCAMTSLSSDPHEFWAGSFGMWLGGVPQHGFGPVLGWTVVGALFLVSMALATEFGFYAQLAGLRGSLSFPLLPPEEAAEEEGGGVAVLEAPDPAEALIQPGERAVEALEEVPGDATDVKLVDRDSHVLDIRRRLREGRPVTDAELDLLDAETAAAPDREAAMAAMDSLFGGPDLEARFPAPAPAAASGAAPAAADRPGPLPFVTYELPPFLLDPSSPHPLVSQEIAAETPAAPPPGSIAAPPEPVEEPPSSHARVISEEDIRVAGTETEDFDPAETSRIVDQAVAWRSPYVFAGVEFMPPNEELADPLADAAAPPSIEPGTEEPVEAGTPAAGAGDAADAATAPEEAAAEGFDGFVVEDEIFSYGLEEDDDAPAGGDAATAVEEPAAEPLPEPAPAEEPAPAGEADPVPESAPVEDAAPVVEAAPVEDAPVEDAPAAPEDASWLEAAAEELREARELEEAVASGQAMEIPPPPAGEAPSAPAAFVDETFVAPESAAPVFIEETYPPVGESVDASAAEPGPAPALEPEPAVDPDDPASVLARLFGEPVTRDEPEILADAADDGPAELSPAGPAHSEPREPPAALGPVTLLNDPDLGDCITDHGIVLDLDQEVVVHRPVVVDDDGDAEEEARPKGAPRPAAPLSAEEAAEAIVGSLRDLFGDPIVDEDPPAAPAEETETEPEEEAPEHHPGFGTLFPLTDEAAAAASAGPAKTDAPAPVVEPLDETEIRGGAGEPVLDDPVLEDPSAEEPVEVIDEVRVSRLVEELRADDAAPGAEDAGDPAPEAPPPPVHDGPVDDLFDAAVEAVKERGRGSVVVLQRKLGIGFTRATRLLDALVARGVVGPENASGSHPVL